MVSSALVVRAARQPGVQPATASRNASAVRLADNHARLPKRASSATRRSVTRPGNTHWRSAEMTPFHRFTSCPAWIAWFRASPKLLQKSPWPAVFRSESCSNPAAAHPAGFPASPRLLRVFLQRPRSFLPGIVAVPLRCQLFAAPLRISPTLAGIGCLAHCSAMGSRRTGAPPGWKAE